MIFLITFLWICTISYGYTPKYRLNSIKIPLESSKKSDDSTLSIASQSRSFLNSIYLKPLAITLGLSGLNGGTSRAEDSIEALEIITNKSSHKYLFFVINYI
jgi:hypothetical protein